MMLGMRPVEVLMSFHTADALKERPAMDRVGILTLEGPVKNGPIYRRYGVFVYYVSFEEEAYASLLKEEFPLGKAMGDLFTESERLGFQLLLKAKQPNILTGMIQLVGYKHERQKSGSERKTILRRIYEELKSKRDKDTSTILGNSPTSTLQ